MTGRPPPAEGTEDAQWGWAWGGGDLQSLVKMESSRITAHPRLTPDSSEHCPQACQPPLGHAGAVLAVD